MRRLNILKKLFELYPQAEWDYSQLSRSSTVNIDIVDKHLDKPWNWKCLPYNPNISLQDIKNNPYLFENLKYLQRNPNMTLEYFKSIQNDRTQWRGILCNKTVTLPEIENYICVTMKTLILKHEKWCYISKNPNITMDFVLLHIKQDWLWNSLSTNPGIQLHDIIKNPDLKWDWSYISMNPNITMDFINKNLDKEWNWRALSENSAITMHDIADNLELPWNWLWISLNPNLTIEFVKQFENKDWYWFDVTCNPGIKIQDIMDNMHLPWHINRLWSNPNITIHFIKKYIQCVDWTMLSYNSFSTIYLWNYGVNYHILTQDLQSEIYTFLIINYHLQHILPNEIMHMIYEFILS